MSQSGAQDAGNDGREREDGIPDSARPRIDPALLREISGSEAHGADVSASEGPAPAPWDVAAEVLESVPDGVEETNSAQTAEPDVAPRDVVNRGQENDPVDTPPAADDETPRPDAIPVSVVSESVAAPASAEIDPEASADAADGSPAAAEPEPDELPDEELVALRAIPLRARIEALLFAATEPLSLARLRNLSAATDPVELRRSLDGLADEYRDSGSALLLTEVGGGFVLRTRPELSPAVARLGRRRDQERLSNAALETLAIVAYRQPVLRVDVEKIRGVASGEVLRSLTEKGLVRVAGRADLPGNPLLYGTTQRFLELFGLRNLRDLPSDDQLLRRPQTDS